jgi:hypothetical protein
MESEFDYIRSTYFFVIWVTFAEDWRNSTSFPMKQRKGIPQRRADSSSWELLFPSCLLLLQEPLSKPCSVG